MPLQWEPKQYTLVSVNITNIICTQNDVQSLTEKHLARQQKQVYPLKPLIEFYQGGKSNLKQESSIWKYLW